MTTTPHKSERLTAMLLAGGSGTRLQSVVSDRPKVLAEVNGRPFLAYLLDQLADAGIRHVVLCTGYRAEQVRETFGERYRELRLSYSHEESPLGTAGAIRQALPFIESETTLVMNGDSYCDANLPAYRAWHREKQSEASLYLVRVPDTTRYGRVEVDADGRILEFREKGSDAREGWINAGIYLLSRRFLECIPKGNAVSIERETFPAWVPQGLFGFQGDGRFLDIGTPETYAIAERFLAGVVHAS